jgi:hypothetical protein
MKMESAALFGFKPTVILRLTRLRYNIANGYSTD